MKKILIVHNKYLNLGGEDLVVLNETELLKKKYDVRTIYFHNTKKLEIFDYLSLLLGVNFKSLNVLKKEIKEFNPDIVYFHNLWYKINTKTVLKACKDVKQVLVKQHNLRHECIQGMHYRAGSLCHLCQEKSRFQGIIKRCYHQSFIKSLLMTIFSLRYLQLLKNKNIKVLTFTNFHIDRLITNKVKKENIFRLNNFLKTESASNSNLDLPEKFICFVGRASKEKGVHLIIEAFNSSNLKNTKLLIVGNTSADIDVKNYSENESIIFKHELKNEDVKYLMSKSKAIVMGSISYEGHPVILSESLASNTILIYPSFSGLNELMPSNYKFSYKHNNPNDLAKVLNLLENNEIYKENKTLLNKFNIENYNEKVFFNQFEITIN